MPRKPRATVTQADLDDPHRLVTDAAERRGKERVYRWVGRGVWAVVLGVFFWGLNHYSIQRNDETRHMHAQETAAVEKKIQKVEDVTKTLAPEAFISTSKSGK